MYLIGVYLFSDEAMSRLQIKCPSFVIFCHENVETKNRPGGRMQRGRDVWSKDTWRDEGFGVEWGGGFPENGKVPKGTWRPLWRGTEPSGFEYKKDRTGTDKDTTEVSKCRWPLRGKNQIGRIARSSCCVALIERSVSDKTDPINSNEISRDHARDPPRASLTVCCLPRHWDFQGICRLSLGCLNPSLARALSLPSPGSSSRFWNPPLDCWENKQITIKYEVVRSHVSVFLLN